MKKKNNKKNNKRELGRKTVILKLEKVKILKNPILIEGLPGLGFVGKLAAEHMVSELKAKKIAELYSPHFPHQVLLNKDGTTRMLKNEFHLYKDPKKKQDLVILIGDVQPTESEAQYAIMNEILDYFESLGGKEIITLGGYSVGSMREKPRVFGATTDKKTIEKYKKYGMVFGEIEGSIVGAAGLLLGLGDKRGINGICLMGETHGNYIDNRSAKSVLEVLSKMLGIKLNTEKLIERAKESEKIIRKIEEETRKKSFVQPKEPTKPGEMSYIR